MATSVVLEEEIAAVRDAINNYLETGFFIRGRHKDKILASLPSMATLARSVAKAQKRPLIVVDTRYDGVHTMTMQKSASMHAVYAPLLLLAEQVSRGWGSNNDVSVVVGKGVVTFWFKNKDILTSFIKSCQEDKACRFALKLPLR